MSEGYFGNIDSEQELSNFRVLKDQLLLGLRDPVLGLQGTGAQPPADQLNALFGIVNDFVNAYTKTRDDDGLSNTGRKRAWALAGGNADSAIDSWYKKNFGEVEKADARLVAQERDAEGKLPTPDPAVVDALATRLASWDQTAITNLYARASDREQLALEQLNRRGPMPVLDPKFGGARWVSVLEPNRLKKVMDERLKRIAPEVWKRGYDLVQLCDAFRTATNSAKRLVRTFLGRHDITIQGTDFFVNQKVRPALYVDQKVAPSTATARGSDAPIEAQLMQLLQSKQNAAQG